jgi:uncharacterized membrane protein
MFFLHSEAAVLSSGTHADSLSPASLARCGEPGGALQIHTVRWPKSARSPAKVVIAPGEQVVIAKLRCAWSIFPVSILHPDPIRSCAHCAAQLTPMWLFGPSLWLHLAAVLLLALGLVLTLRRGTAVRGSLVRFGPTFFAVPLAVFGLQHFALFDTVKFAVPPYMPARFFWAYLVGAALIAACLSILTEIHAELAAFLLGIMLFLFVLMIYVPNLINNPGDRFAITVPLRDLALSGGALSLASALGGAQCRPSARWLLEVGRWFFGAPMLYFGVEHFLHPAFAPGMPFPLLAPAWLPGHVVWAYSTGTVFVICGLSILTGKRAQAAATWLGASFLALVVLIYLPMEIVHPSIAISGELDYVADTLAMSGAALLVARAVAVRNAQGTMAVKAL